MSSWMTKQRMSGAGPKNGHWERQFCGTNPTISRTMWGTYSGAGYGTRFVTSHSSTKETQREETRRSSVGHGHLFGADDHLGLHTVCRQERTGQAAAHCLS